MQKELIKYLRSPISNTPLSLEVFEEGPLGKSPSHILSGRLYNSEGEEYPIQGPHHVAPTYSANTTPP